MTFNQLYASALSKIQFYGLTMMNHSCTEAVRIVDCATDTPSGWRDKDLQPEEVAGLLVMLTRILQEFCMSTSNGHEAHDQELYNLANLAQRAWVEAANERLGTEFDLKPVRSRIDEMADAGLVTITTGEDGVRLVSLTPAGARQRGRSDYP